jgi:hypothetical protein
MCLGQPELGSKARPFQFYIDSSALLTPSTPHALPHTPHTPHTLQALHTLHRQQMTQCLETYTGFRFHFVYAQQSTSLALALAHGQTHAALTSLHGYQHAHKHIPLIRVLDIPQTDPDPWVVVCAHTLDTRVSQALKEGLTHCRSQDPVAFENLLGGDIFSRQTNL